MKFAISETYALNLAQILHMLLLAAFVPWYIGIESYGIFAALFAAPSLFQSSFETFTIAIMTQHLRRDAMNSIILFFVIPSYFAFCVFFFLFLDIQHAIAISLMTLFLFTRSYAFAICISAGSLTKKLIHSEGIVFLMYVFGILFSIGLDVRDEMLPIIMVTSASAATTAFLIRASHTPVRVLRPLSGVTAPRLPLRLIIGASMGKLLEDGFLTFTPLLLAIVSTPTVAGQFRIFVSSVKAAYKLFPFRHEVVLRDVPRGRLGFKPLATASAIFALGSIFAAIGALFLLPAIGFSLEGIHWLLILFAGAGATVSSLALYPVSSALDRRVPSACLAVLLLTDAVVYWFGPVEFAVCFTVSIWLILAFTLNAIRQMATPNVPSPIRV